MFPLLGAGVGGVDMDPMTPVGSLLRHWVYALPFLYFLKPGNRVQSAVVA